MQKFKEKNVTKNKYYDVLNHHYNYYSYYSYYLKATVSGHSLIRPDLSILDSYKWKHIIHWM